jgi:RNA polymerase sigma-70 factor (ECF subfamily)
MRQMVDWGGFEEFYVKEYPRVLASLTLVAGSLEWARDATDEAFARALDRWDRVHDMASPGGWVYRVGLNLVRRRLRRAALERRVLHRHTPELPVPEPVATDVWNAVKSLPDRQRLAVVLRYVADLPETEVATVMGVARGTVSAALTAARARLQTLLVEEDRLERDLA